MANEITLNGSLSITNGSFKETFNPGQIRITQSAQGGNAGVWIVGTTTEAMPAGDVSNKGYLCLRNLDATNFVTLYATTGGNGREFGKLNAGEYAIFRMSPSKSLVGKADTANVKVQMLLLEA